MAKAISLHVGVNFVGDTPTPASLVGCVSDAESMRDLPQLSNFDRREFLPNLEAKLDVVKNRITQAAADLESGGIFVFTFAGHGSFIGDEDGEEPDLNDETLVLNDLMLVDDVLGRELWPLFKPNTRILMIADSCYSGTVSALVARGVHTGRKKPFLLSVDAYRRQQYFRTLRTACGVRTLSEELRFQHLRAHREFYDKLLNDLARSPQVNASVILLAACQDNETTGDGLPHGVFTQALLDVLNGPSPPQNYDDFIGQIGAKLKLAGHNQTPVLTVTGQPNPKFRAERPFTV